MTTRKKAPSRNIQSKLEAFHTVSLRMSAAQDLEEVLELIARTSLELLDIEEVHIYLYQTQADFANAFRKCIALRHDHQLPVPPPATLFDQIAQRQWPLVVNRLTQQTREANPYLAGWQVKSLAGYPLTRGGRLLGVFLVASTKTHHFTSSERLLLSLLSDQASMAIENQRVVEELSASNSALYALHRLAHRISSTLDTEALLHTIVGLIKELFKADITSVMLLQPNQQLRLAATAGDSMLLLDKPILALGEGIAGRVVMSGEAIYLPDVSREPQFAPLESVSGSLLAVPLISRSRVIGVLSLQSEQPYHFDPNAHTLVTVAANQAAIAIDNANLYQEKHRQINEQEIILELGRIITQSLKIEDVFEAANNAVKGLMACDAFLISLCDRHPENLMIAYLNDKGVRYPPQPLSPGGGMSAYVLKNGQPILVHDLLSDDLPFTPIVYGSEEITRSLIGVPISSGSRTIGILSAQSYQPGAYSKHDVRLLENIANFIAIAIENANLYTDLEKNYQALHESERLRNELTQNVTHELRTPLTYVKSYLELLLEGEQGELNAQQQQSLHLMRDKVTTLERIVEDLTLLEQHKREHLILEDVHLVPLLEKAVLMAKDSAIQKGITIQLHAPEDFPILQADAARVSQVMDNLLSNAIKFGQSDGRIEIRLQTIPHYALVSVFNQGTAIQKDHQERLFERFYQADPSQKGLGLGLAIVRRIIEMHQGRVWLESEEGEGNTFFFTLPLEQKANLEE